MTKSLPRHYRRFGEWITEETGLQTFSETDIDDADVTFSGRVFHSREAATGKARSPMVKKTGASDNKRWCRASSADDGWSSSARYGGAVWCRHLYTRTARLNSMRSGTFSQCICVRTGNEYRWELYSQTCKIRRANSQASRPVLELRGGPRGPGPLSSIAGPLSSCEKTGLEGA